MSINQADASRLCLLRAIEAAKPVQFFHPSVGRRTRCYLSQAGIASYEAGHQAFCAGSAPPTVHGPFHDGWWDAHSEVEEQFWSRADEVFEPEDE